MVGLQLCPFAKPMVSKGLIRYEVCEATEQGDIVDVLDAELTLLNAADPLDIETTLFILPCVQGDFLDFHFLVEACRKRLKALRLKGILQLADFHPQYVFAGSQADDVVNATNRSPYPTLHLLREDSVERARGSSLDADSIVERNQRVLRELGWNKLSAIYEGDNDS